MVCILCLPSVYPVTISNLNYSPLALGGVLIYAVAAWHLDAKKWFRGALANPLAAEALRESESAGDKEVKDFIPSSSD